MKSPLCLAALLLAATTLEGFSANRDAPQHRAEIVCHLGKLDSGSGCTANATKPGTPPEKKGKMTCGFKGKVAEIVWTFARQKDGKDLYDFSLRFPIKSDDGAAQTKRVSFDGKRVIVFEDKHQVIVIQSPKA